MDLELPALNPVILHSNETPYCSTMESYLQNCFIFAVWQRINPSYHEHVSNSSFDVDMCSMCGLCIVAVHAIVIVNSDVKINQLLVSAFVLC
jgi:hypothetical protein